MRVEQRTGKTRTVCSPQLSRAALDGALTQGERRWERLVELNREPQEPANPIPQPTSHTEPTTAEYTSLVLSHWTEDTGPRA